MKLPILRRYNWPLGRWRHQKQRVLVWSMTILLISLVLFGLEFTFEQSSRIEAEAAHKALIADILKQGILGAPGTTWTDWKEGTSKWKK